MAFTIKLGVADFAKYRKTQSYYVDKTGFLEQFLLDWDEVTLFTRPRRFGKTLMMSMMAEFLDITKQSAELFEGLAISRNEKLCQEWMNQYPVIFLTFKDICDPTCEQAINHITDLIAEYISKHLYLLESPRIAPNRKQALHALFQKQADALTMKKSLYILCNSLFEYYKKPAIIIIDEYDVPVSNALNMKFYDEIMEFMRMFMSISLKENNYMMFGVLTGCLNILKASVYTGLNNIKVFGISENKYADAFGFTEDEVRRMLETFGLEDKMEEVREWYDGYHFGNREDIYCPWGITNYVSDHVTSSCESPQAYWLNTSGNDIARNVLAKTDINLTEKIEKLIDGGSIRFLFRKQMNYADIYTSESYFWSLMYLTGYLTMANEAQQKSYGRLLNKEDIVCCIPNKEVAGVWQTQVQQWFASVLQKQDGNNFTTALWQGDCAGLENILVSILLKRLSVHDLREYAYHVLLVALFPDGYLVKSNRESGLGRYDILALDGDRNRAAVIEVKRADTEQQLAARAEEALQQIAEKMYDTDLRTELRSPTILHYGIAFCGKLCKVLMREAQP